MLNIRLLKASFYKPSEITGNLAVVNQIRGKYGDIIKEACSGANARLETYILESLIFIESKGDAKAVNGQAYGIAQIDTATASNIPYWLSKKAKIMTASQRAKVYELFGKTRGDCLLNLSYDNAPSKCSGGKDSINLVTKAELLNPEIGIWLCAMYLDYLIDMYSYGGSIIPPKENTDVKMERVIVHYNTGQGTVKRVPTNLSAGDTLNYVRTKISPITSDYITKFIGTNGMIDVLTNPKYS